MKQLIQDQTVSFDTHQAGDGREVLIDQLHLHKRMNGKKHKGVNIKIPLDPNKPIDYGIAKEKIGRSIINEIRKVFRKDPDKVREFAKYVANQIDRYGSGMSENQSRVFLAKTSEGLAKHFELNSKIKKKLSEEINNYVTIHNDVNGKKYYIRQNLVEKEIEISDSFEDLYK